MRVPRVRFTVRWMMCGIVCLALVLTVISQNTLLRRSASREQQLRAALTRAEARLAWVEAINQWHRLEGSPSLRKRWAATIDHDDWVRAVARPAG